MLLSFTTDSADHDEVAHLRVEGWYRATPSQGDQSLDVQEVFGVDSTFLRFPIDADPTTIAQLLATVIIPKYRRCLEALRLEHKAAAREQTAQRLVGETLKVALGGERLRYNDRAKLTHRAAGRRGA